MVAVGTVLLIEVPMAINSPGRMAKEVDWNIPREQSRLGENNQYLE